MIHIPRIRGYWRHHDNAATNSGRRIAMADERIRLAAKHLESAGFKEKGRRRVMAAAHLTAGAIIARNDDAAAFHHFAAASQLDREFLDHLPENMAAYPALWPLEVRSVLDLQNIDQSSAR